MLTYIEISKVNLLSNLHTFKRLLPINVEIVVVVKANAYGHGLSEIATILDNEDIIFQVDDIEELRLIRTSSSKKTLILGYIADDDIKEAITLNSSIVVYSFNKIKKIQQEAILLGIIQPIHIMIDSFFGREGIFLDDLKIFIDEIKNSPNILLEGIYSHFSNIDVTNDKHADYQLEYFKEALNLCENNGFNNLSIHISATAGILMLRRNNESNNLPDTSVRLGIGLYGIWPSVEVRELYNDEELKLYPVMRWVTHISQVKLLPDGFPIGYGLTYITENETKIAIIPQGYSDGYDRRLSNTGEVLIHGNLCKILGRISMNMFVVDVTSLEGVKEGDEVVLLGSQGEEIIKADDIAKHIGTIPYEVVARISTLIPRVII